jgi:fumarate reductase subunit C
MVGASCNGRQSAQSRSTHVSVTTPVTASLQPGTAPRRSAWPARLDVLQSASGLVLALFMWMHMLFVASILLGPQAMWTVARFFEGYFLLGRSVPGLVAALVAAVLALVVLHAALALRKFPAGYAEFVAFRRHASGFGHADTSLWGWQVATGFALFFLVTVHLYGMLVHPGRIGPYESADRVWSETMWPLYLVMLFAVEVHGGIGLYRVALKWGVRFGPDPAVTRTRLRRLKWFLTACFLALGLAALAAYVRLGIEHAPHRGEPYVPAGVHDVHGVRR